MSKQNRFAVVFSFAIFTGVVFAMFGHQLNWLDYVTGACVGGAACWVLNAK